MSSAVIVAVNYYRDRNDWASSAAGSVLFFRGGSTFSELDSDGYLPDNRIGDLTGLFVRLRTVISATLTAAAAKATLDDIEEMRDLLFQIYLNNNEIFRGPVWAFPHPPSWYSGQITVAMDGAANTLKGQNAGFMLLNIAHPIGARQSVQGRLTGDAQVATTVPVEITIQVADKRAVITS